MPIIERKKSIQKSYVLYDCQYMTFQKRQDYRDRKKGWWLPGIKEEGRMNRQNTEDIQGSETILYTTMGHTCHTSVKAHRMCNTMSECWVTGNKYTTMGQMLLAGEGGCPRCRGWGGEATGNSQIPLSDKIYFQYLYMC